MRPVFMGCAWLISGLALTGCLEQQAARDAADPAVDNTRPPISSANQLGLREAGPGGPPADPPSPTDTRTRLLPPGPTEKDFPHLHNLFQVTDQLYSGGEPKDEQAFAELAKLGIEVVVSVDGARPKVELARKYGIRYVHIPIGYDAIDPAAARSFARAADELQGKVYVHCHHGKHRGPAAAAAICVARGDADGPQALKILQQAGTSKGYAGLWRDVENFRRPSAETSLPELVAVAEVGSLAAAMATIDRASDNLKLGQAAGWKTPADHPDVSPSQEALLLKEGFRETVRQLAAANDYDPRFLEWMKESELLAAQLETKLKTPDLPAASTTFAELQDQCKRCHAAYRH